MIARAVFTSLMLTATLVASSTEDLMPMPREVTRREGRLAIVEGAGIDFGGATDRRIQAAANLMLDRWEAKTGLVSSSGNGPDFLRIDCQEPSAAIPVLGEDESYALTINEHEAVLRAPSTLGVLRGLATLEQLLDSSADGWFLPAVEIHDSPRFPWRGLMLDVCRHWQPMDVLKRTLDGMASVKLNVLHLHLTEDQGFRIESQTHPELHEQGSDGNYFTQDEMREIIAYAAERGIRVVPEFDMPGHVTSWLVSHPEIGSAPGPYEIERKWGIFEPVLDPTNEKTYELLGGFLGEMAALFPDEFLHIGGDEVEGSHWKENAGIRAFMREHGLESNADLQAMFNQHVEKILAKNGKRMVGWDEILHPGVPTTAVIQSWRGPESLAEAARKGYSGILSNGYYIDLSHPTADHYLTDPLPEDLDLTEAEQARVLGGEATMWSEWVTPETIDSRIWPRTAAIAERFWSPRNIRDVDDMHRRLALQSQRLEELGLAHVTYIDPMLRRLAGPGATTAELDALRMVADIVEPVKKYRRGREQPNSNQLTPLTGLVDASRPDSMPSRTLTTHIESAIFEGASPEPVVEMLGHWQQAAALLANADLSPRVGNLRPLFTNLDAACSIGVSAAEYLATATAPPDGWCKETLDHLNALAKPVDACEMPFLPALRRLVVAADLSQKRDRTPEEWRKQVDTLAATEDND